MMRSVGFAVFAILFAHASAAGDEPELTNATYAKWRDYVLPSGDELGYQQIAWRTSFWDAVIEAQERDRPVLLWTMNGHPLCNT